MTERECFESCLIELNKVLAPALLLDDFNYLFRKAILKYFNKRYNLFETSLLLTDDLRVLVKTEKLTEVTSREDPGDVMGASYKFNLPTDYVHILNCVCEFADKAQKCASGCAIIRLGANKLNTSQWSSVITNYYMRPSVKRPYYYITNIDNPAFINGTLTNPIPKGEIREDGQRYGNAVTPTLEIKCGSLDPSKYELKCIYVEYLRAPYYVNLTLDDLDKVLDETHVMEFPDYVIYEIINELVTSILENGKDPRILTFPAINTSIPLK